MFPMFPRIGHAAVKGKFLYKVLIYFDSCEKIIVRDFLIKSFKFKHASY